MARRAAKAKAKTATNKRRKGALAVLMPWMRRFGLRLGFVVFALWAGAWLWLNGSVHAAGMWGHERMLEITASAGFRVENILVEGRVNSNADIILAMVNMQEGDPLFAFQPRAAQRQIQKINWVQDVAVERRFPDTIYIHLTERTPLALWQKGKTLHVLDEAGAMVSTDDLARFKDLPVVSGKDAPVHMPALMAEIKAAPFLAQRVRRAVWIGGRRWDLYLKNGIAIKMPEDNMGQALERLGAAHAESALLDKAIVSLDLREDDRIAVQTQPGAVQDYQAGLKAKAENKTNAKSGNNI